MKSALVLLGAVLVGDFIAQQFIIKSGPDDTSGFIEQRAGFGLDDVARAATIVGVAILAKKALG